MRTGPRASADRWHVGLLAASLVVIALFIAIAIASPMRSAPFRLFAQTDFMGLTVKGDAHLSFDVVDWELRGLRLAQTPALAPTILARVGEPGDAAVADRFDLWLRQGDELLLERLPDRLGRPRFALSLPTSQVPVAMQLADAPQSPLLAGRDGELKPLTMPGSLRGEIGGRGDAAFVFSLARVPDSTRPRVAVSGVGFGRPIENGRIQAGLTGGSLLFLDKPEVELRLWRGSDLRLRDIDAELSSVVLSADGIEAQLEGLTADATLHVGTGAHAQRMRRVMPTYYDKLKGEPVLAVLLGLAGFVSGAAGLVLSAAQVSNRLAARVRHLGGE